MTWFADLDPCTYFGEACAPNLKAVGWLEADQPYQSGDLPEVARRKLAALVREAYQPWEYLGGHSCALCSKGAPWGSRNLFVPGPGFLYVCPELILHYIDRHHYRPPNEFCNAVLRCPRPWTLAYEHRFLQNGGKHLRATHRNMLNDFPLKHFWIVRLLGGLLP